MANQVRVKSTPDPPRVEVCLSDAPVECECAGDVIADVNRLGNWIRGLELLGSAGFSLERALAPFSPKPRAASVRSAQADLAVTYDGEADAGFLYLPYASPASVEHDPLLLESSHSIEDERQVARSSRSSSTISGCAPFIAALSR